LGGESHQQPRSDRAGLRRQAVEPAPGTPAFQLRFLDFLQRILQEGSFSGTYKLALLLALADLAVERGGDGAAELALERDAVTRRVFAYYLPQARPFPGAGGRADILTQNHGETNVQVEVAREGRRRYGDVEDHRLLDVILRDQELRGRLRANVFQWPVRHLQNLPEGEVPLLYHLVPRGPLVLHPGISACFRRFHGLVHHLVRGAWVEWIQNQRHNRDLVGGQDLYSFLFGAERQGLEVYRPLLIDLQQRRCFYCGHDLRRRRSEVDHFIPWSRYPVDLGHNFVLACRTCNGDKRDRLPAAPRYVDAWRERNTRHLYVLQDYFRTHALPHDRDASDAVGRWAYEQARVAEARLWRPGDPAVPFPAGWTWPGHAHPPP
jgi:5-methylcytosine-specific restriction endonuclease McrA